MQMIAKQMENDEVLNMILKELVVALSDTGKTIEEYHEERINERYIK